MNLKILQNKKVTVCLLLVAITLLAYWPVHHHEFINFDDDLYITGNQKVKAGLTADGLIWAFDFNGKSYWHPLTWLSHMLDVELFGLNAAAHHLTNLWIHLVNALLLFGVLYRATGRLYRCAFIAALFAVHPLNVDSVAWMAERKNLLSTFFWVLTMLLYMCYAERPTVKRYGLMLLAFACGLMTKPMLVTLPFVLLLLDYWPLKRLDDKHGWQHSAIWQDTVFIPARQSGGLRLIVEKLPLLMLSGASIWVSILSTQDIDMMVATDTVPLTLRIGNALVSYLSYLSKIFWPHNLAIFYPFPKTLPLWLVVGSGVLLFVITTLFLLRSNRKPYLATGWLWYLGTLVPVIGIVQAGVWPAMADRWVYIPMIGILIIMVWAPAEMITKWRPKMQVLVTVLGVSAVVCCVFLVRGQLQHWQNSRLLFKHALDVTGGSDIAHNNLGSALLWEGDFKAALHHFKAALKLNPLMTKVHNNIGQTLVNLGRVNEAVDRYRVSLKLNPLEAETHNGLAVALLEQGHIKEALHHLHTAVRLEPNYGDVYVNLGAVYRQQGKIKMAVRYYLQALRLNPYLPEAHNNLGLLLMIEGKLKAAAAFFHKALEINPDFDAARENLKKLQTAQTAYRQRLAQLNGKIKRNPDNADLYLQLGDLYKDQGALNQALENYQKAFIIRPKSRPVMKKLAIGQAMTGNYDQAVELFRKMIGQQPNDTEPYIYIAGIYARQNKAAESIEWLKRAIARGYHDWDRLQGDSNFDNIRENAAFKALVLPKS